jgi:hypothetical protein
MALHSDTAPARQRLRQQIPTPDNGQCRRLTVAIGSTEMPRCRKYSYSSGSMFCRYSPVPMTRMPVHQQTSAPCCDTRTRACV